MAEKEEEIFQKEAESYDVTILKIIPSYDKMLDILLKLIPFPKNKSFKVIDLGCGTGTLPLKIKEAYPNAIITCLDVAEKMIELCKIKLAKYEDIICEVTDLHDYEFSDDYDLIISSLALHHLRGDKKKKEFYEKIYAHLAPGGAFYNLDVVIGENKLLEDLNVSNWVEFMLKSSSREEVIEELLPNYYHKEIPTNLVRQISWLMEIGFNDVDIIWKNFHFAIFGGFK